MRWILLFVFVLFIGIGAASVSTANATGAAVTAEGAPTLPGWETFGPFGGNVTSLITNAQNPNVVYAMSHFWNNGSALHRSDDGGMTWKLAGLYPATQDVEIIFDPRDPNTLYANRDPSEYDYAYGPVRSRDGGQTWHMIRQGLYDRPDRIYLHPRYSNILYTHQQGAAYRSDNYGNGWQPINPPVTPASYYNPREFALSPTAAQTLYQITERGGEYFIYYSTDGGASWARRDTGLPRALEYSYLTISPVDSNRLYIVVNHRELYQSGDGGASWTLFNTLPQVSAYRLLADPARRDGLYLYSEKLYRLDEAGAWSLIPTEVPEKIYTVAILPTNGERLLLGTDDGVYISEDGGQQWTRHSEGLGSMEVRLRADPHTPNRLYAPGWGSALYRSDDGGLSWQTLNADFDQLLDLDFDPHTPDRLYAIEYPAGLYTSDDGGLTWIRDSAVNGARTLTISDAPQPTIYLAKPRRLMKRESGGVWSQLPFTFPAEIEEIVLNPQDEADITVLLNGSRYDGWEGGRIFRSTDGGQNWTEQGYLDCTVMSYGGIEYTLCPRIHAMVIHPDNPAIRTLAAADWASGIYRSNDYGATWALLYDPPYQPNTLVMHPDDPDKLFIGTMMTWTAAGYHPAGGRFLWSEDGGATWRERSVGLNNRAVYSIAPDPFNLDEVYLGAFGGVYRQTAFYGIYLPLAMEAPRQTAQ